jgi:hypothetical protein
VQTADALREGSSVPFLARPRAGNIKSVQEARIQEMVVKSLLDLNVKALLEELSVASPPRGSSRSRW